jgi:membrane-associated protease RseP (regulator of RpoE activity)
MAILVVHELGHYVAARIHKVRASLPYFIPAPLLSAFGTMGAAIVMPDRIRRRDALLDIGAAGPLAGLVVAVPVLLYGLATSPVQPLPARYALEGQSLFYLAAKRLVLGPIPDGSDVFMNPVAFAGWTGLLLTAVNLIPVSQLDGGHIAYALFGPRWDRIARWVHFGLLGFFVFNLVRFMLPAAQSGGGFGQAFGNSVFWLVWFALIAVIKSRTGGNHPPTDPGPLSRGRRAVAIVCLVLFVLLFMPTPWATYG